MPVSVGCSPGAAPIRVGSPLAGRPRYRSTPTDRATYTASVDAHPVPAPVLRCSRRPSSARSPSDGMRLDIAPLVVLPLAAPPASVPIDCLNLGVQSKAQGILKTLRLLCLFCG